MTFVKWVSGSAVTAFTHKQPGDPEIHGSTAALGQLLPNMCVCTRPHMRVGRLLKHWATHTQSQTNATPFPHGRDENKHAAARTQCMWTSDARAFQRHVMVASVCAKWRERIKIINMLTHRNRAERETGRMEFKDKKKNTEVHRSTAIDAYRWPEYQ